jgi:hypothetical protein
MKDEIILDQLQDIKSAIGEINFILDDLHSKGVDVKIRFNENEKLSAGQLELWMAVERYDYLKDLING